MRNLDLINWTIHEAQQLTPEYQVPGALDNTPSTDRLLEVSEGGRLKPNTRDTVSQIAGAPAIQVVAEGQTGAPSSQAVASSQTNIVSNLRASTPPAPSPNADGWVEVQMSKLPESYR
jgi:hypothetical protein